MFLVPVRSDRIYYSTLRYAVPKGLSTHYYRRMRMLNSRYRFLRHPEKRRKWIDLPGSEPKCKVASVFQILSSGEKGAPGFPTIARVSLPPVTVGPCASPVDHGYQIHSQYPPLPFSFNFSPSLLLPPPPASPSLPLLSSAARTRRRVPQVLFFLLFSCVLLLPRVSAKPTPGWQLCLAHA